MARLGGLQSALSALLMNLATLAVLAVAIPLVSAGQIDGVELALLILATIASFEAVLPLPQAFQSLENNLEAGRRLFEIVDAEPEVTSPASPRPTPEHFDLRLQDVTFAYEPGGPPALDGVSFDLLPLASASFSLEASGACTGYQSPVIGIYNFKFSILHSAFYPISSSSCRNSFT